MKTSKKLLAGVLASVAMFAAVPMMPVETGCNFGIVASAEEDEHTFTGEVNKVIAVGYLITPSADSEEAGKAAKFMVKYSDVDSFSIGDTVTITYSGDPEIDNSIATITATNIVAGAVTEATTEATTEAETEAQVDAIAKDDDTEKKPTETTSSTPATGEGIGVIAGAGILGIVALAIRKRM